MARSVARIKLDGGQKVTEETLMKQKYGSLSICLSVCLSVCLPVCLSATAENTPVWRGEHFEQRGCGTLFSPFIHSAVRLTTGPQSLPQRVLHTVRSSASSCNLQHPLVSLRPSSNCLRLIPCLHVISALPSIFPAITCSKWQFIRKMWPIRLTFLLFYCT